jgi:hypothetical protein
MSWFLATSSDLTVLLVIAGGFVLTAIGVAEIAYRVFFVHHIDEVDPHAKLLDLVHSSLLAFVAFMLVISVTDVRANFARADDAVSREAMHIAAFDREIGEQDPAWAAPTRALLRRYVEAVTGDEWARLGTAQPSLSAQAQTFLDGLRVALRTVPASETERTVLRGYHDGLELDRAARYERATRSIPKIFWVLIGGFLAGAMMMNGRYRPSVLTRTLVAVHFAAIGMSVALIFILDAPFRGETSIAPTELLLALNPR